MFGVAYLVYMLYTLGMTTKGNTMNTTKMTIAELSEAVEAYTESGFDPNAMRPLMDLLQDQTDYYQKRFWKMVDAQR